MLRAALARARAEEQPAGMPLHCRRRPRSVWRCADTTREPLWGTLARFLTTASRRKSLESSAGMASRFGRGALSQFALHIVEIGLDRLAAEDVLNDDEPAERFHVADDVFGNDADPAFVAANTGRLEGSAVQAKFVRHSRESN